jgi:hypothetical protein
MGVRERERESRMGWWRQGEQGQCRELTLSESRHQMLGKPPLTKKAHEKILTSIEQSLTAGPTARLAGEKMVQQRIWARRGFYRKGRLRKLVHAR